METKKNVWPAGGDVSLDARCRISNAARADLFVSLHGSATGTGTKRPRPSWRR